VHIHKQIIFLFLYTPFVHIIWWRLSQQPTKETVFFINVIKRRVLTKIRFENGKSYDEMASLCKLEFIPLNISSFLSKKTNRLR